MSVDSRKELTNGKYIDDQMANGVPAGGSTGQVLKKNSNSDYDVGWGAGGGGGTGSGTVTQVDTAGLISGGPITDSGTITTNMNTNKLVGRYDSNSGIMQEISLGTGISIVEGTLTVAGVSAGQALTRTNDTNVTLTLGGSPTTALFAATSLTLGWTGQLSVARGGTGLSTLGTANQLLRVNIGQTGLEYFTPAFELTANKNQPNGYPGLNSSSEITSSQVKGVLQYTDFASFPATGDQYKLYIDQSTRLHYYWNPNTSAYVKIGSYSSDFTVYLKQTDGFKTFLKWKNGETVPAAGKHPQELLKLGAQEGIPPVVGISLSVSSVPFYTTSVSTTITLTKTVNLPATAFSSVLLEWKRNNGSIWTTLSTDINTTTYSFTNANSPANNTNAYNFRYTVVDNVGASTTVTTDLTVQGYAAPSVGGFTTSGGSTRELGNVASTVTGTIYRNSPNINLVSYQIEYQLNGTGAWTAIGTPTNITAGVSSVDFSVNHASSAGTLNATSISYRVKVADAYVSVTYLGEGDNVVYFYIKRILGFSSNTSLTVAQINAITNLADVSFTNNVYADISNVTSGGANYTYYCYSSSATDITNITLDGSAPVTTSFVKQVPDVTGTNSYGATVTYKVYKSDAKGAYTNNRLTIS
jgi:hypothetical protein